MQHFAFRVGEQPVTPTRLTIAKKMNFAPMHVFCFWDE